MNEKEIDELFCNHCKLPIGLKPDDLRMIIKLHDGDILNISCQQCSNVIYTNSISKDLFNEDDYDK